MSSAVLHRPGVLAGVYPQREEIRAGWLEKTAAAAVGKVHQYALGRNPRYSKFVKTVDEHAVGFDSLNDNDLAARVVELRKQLYARGLQDELVAESFAIVREVATRKLGMRHYDVQLYGGWVMLQGMVAEMETGEGKTLTATLAASTAALAGIPVHVVTVNDFLASRDAKWMQPIYSALGLKVGTITEGLEPDQRRAAYARDITYCTNKQLVFDYLRDRMLLGKENRGLHLNLEELYAEKPRTSRLLLRGLCFAIVDEADSVLVDEARTPLIISNRTNSDDQDKVYKHAVRIARSLQSPRDYAIKTSERQVELTDLGKATIARMTKSLGSVWSGPKRREELVKQGLSALYLFEADKHYLVQDGKVQIIDEFTGRIMEDRSWERGLHQMVEAKEGCAISGRQETLSRISYQKFFQRYLKLGGMTGTAREVASELWSVYRLNVVTIPTNNPTQRLALRDRMHLSAEDKWRDTVQYVREAHEQGRPVLVGTRSVAASETLSEELTKAGLRHRVLNARQNQQEAEIIAQAGQPGRITVATNMAGRGTDIRLAPGLAELGGLHVLATERHEARRIDRQLFGRGGRQGDPGSYQAILAMEDELFADLLGERLSRWLSRVTRPGVPVNPLLATLLTVLAQRAAESRQRKLRRNLLKLDENLGDMLAFSGRGE
jgi:preprotein translocase subunit SecA